MADENKQDAIVEEQQSEEKPSEGQDAAVENAEDESETPVENATQENATPEDEVKHMPGDDAVTGDESSDYPGGELADNAESDQVGDEGETPPEDQPEDGHDLDKGHESRQDLEDEFPDLSNVKMEETVAHPAEFQQLSGSPGGQQPSRSIDILMDVKMPIAIELGRTEMPISEILSLGPGSVVELDKLAGEPVDLLVNGKIVARGEVVVVDENFGVRITMLMSPQERLKSLSK
jgi:flagellar motor switch protein FliN/FliY